jgi:phosphate transport system substrate-binding protein
MHKTQENMAKGAEVLRFFEWALKNGQKMAAEMDYVPLPAPVVKLIEDAWKKEPRGTDGKAIWK